MLRREISAQGDDGASTTSVASPLGLEKVVKGMPQGTLVVSGTGSFSDEDWKRIDLNRSRLDRAGSTVLVLDDAALARLERAAPNLSSWIGGAIWLRREPVPLDPASAGQRLAVLRGWAGMDDTEGIRRAEAG